MSVVEYHQNFMNYPNYLKMTIKFLLVSFKRFFEALLLKYFGNIYLKYKSYDEVTFIFQFIKNNKSINNIMLDVGAHTGSSAFLFSKKKWIVHCFEPDKKNFYFLKKYFQKCTNVHLNKLAVTDQNGHINFYKSNVSDGISSVVKFHKSHSYSYKVYAIRLDSYLFKNKINQIGFLKIDVEGNDFNSLKSINLNKYNPQIILIEFEDNKFKNCNHSTIDILNYLESEKYHFMISEWFPIEKYGTKHKWKSLNNINQKKYNKKGWGNIIASRDHEFLTSLRSSILDLKC